MENNNNNNNNDDGGDCVWFSQLVANGGTGLPEAPSSGAVFDEDIVIKISKDTLNEFNASSLTVMLILSGDAYFDIEDISQAVINIPVVNSSVKVGSIGSGYPIRVRNVLRFYGVFTLQAVLMNKVSKASIPSCTEIIENGIQATNPYALFTAEK
ncbi:MAG: hypothetical protein QM613_00955 [Micrococcaceae bacterium]